MMLISDIITGLIGVFSATKLCIRMTDLAYC